MQNSTLMIIACFISYCMHPNISSAQTNQELDTTIAIGKRIYQQGILPNGNQLVGIGAGNVKLTGSQASCIRCHRRSGFGSTEADLRISPILGDILYSERNKSYKELQRRRTKGHGARPAYTDKTLKNAIMIGSGADNRELNKLMPRYKLSDIEVNAVIVYLKSLTFKNEPGITKDDIHIATIFRSGANKKSNKAMLDLLNSYIKDVNAKTRKEHRRASNSPWHKKWEYESYRTIKLHSWKLNGPQSSWKQQLQSYYKKQNVFAVINGIGNTTQNVIHDFCNQTELPCLFPTTELPVLSNDNIYNFYYSGGISFDAKTIAAHIKSIKNSPNKTVLQIYRKNNKSNINKTAAAVLKNDLLLNKTKIQTHIIATNEKLSTAQLSNIIKQYKPDILIAWLDNNDVEILNSGSKNIKSLERIYYSYSHIGKPYPESIKNNKDKSYIVYRYMLPKRKELHMKRATVWASRKNIDISDEKIVGNAFFSITLFNRAIKKMRAYLKKDYLVEIIESMLENNAFQSVYPDLSLGPDQRIASNGAYILGPLNNKDVNKKENHIWIRH